MEAIFLCQLQSNSIAIEWQINNESFRAAAVNGTRKEGRGNNTEALIILAIPQFNESSVVCITYDNQTTPDFIDSTPARLIVQGCKVNSFPHNNNNIIIY